MDLETLRNWVGRFLQDTSFKYYGGDDTSANRAINYAIKFVSTQVPYDLLGTLQGLETEDIDASAVQYSLPDDFYWFKKAKWNGYWCEKLAVEDIDLPDTNSFNAASATAPLCYICENKITYSPIITEGEVDARLLYYVEVAADLSSDSDPNPLSSLLDYAVALKATEILASKHADDKRWADKFEREISNWRTDGRPAK